MNGVSTLLVAWRRCIPVVHPVSKEIVFRNCVFAPCVGDFLALIAGFQSHVQNGLTAVEQLMEGVKLPEPIQEAYPLVGKVSY